MSLLGNKCAHKKQKKKEKKLQNLCLEEGIVCTSKEKGKSH